MAGLWERWHEADGSELESCCILTREPNELMRPIHDRMPVVVEAERYARWLDVEGEVDEGEAVADLLGPWDAGEWEAVAVSRYVNSPEHEGPRCVEPAEEEEGMATEAGHEPMLFAP